MGVRLSLRRREQLLGLALISPAVLFIGAVVIYPGRHDARSLTVL